MLVLRRTPYQAILIFDSRVEIWVTVLSIDMDSATLRIGPTKTDGTAVQVPLFESVPILQGDGKITLTDVTHLSDGDALCAIGIDAPMDMTILREELAKGLTREQRSKMAR